MSSLAVFLLLAWLNYLDRQGIVPLAILCCALHELGHWIVILLCGGNVKQIRLTAIGAEMILDRQLNYWQEGLAALAGPAVNLLLALVFSGWKFGLLFAGLNLMLGCFNLLPVGRLDGGRVLCCAMALLFGPNLAHEIARLSDVVFVTVLTAMGILFLLAGGNVTLLLVALWLAVRLSPFDSGNSACHMGRNRVK